MARYALSSACLVATALFSSAIHGPGCVHVESTSISQSSQGFWQVNGNSNSIQETRDLRQGSPLKFAPSGPRRSAGSRRSITYGRGVMGLWRLWKRAQVPDAQTSQSHPQKNDDQGKETVYFHEGFKLERKPQVKTSAAVVDDDDPCNIYDVNGCSVPLGLPFFYKTQFTPACNRHDICYSCGIGQTSRRECDVAFLKDMTDTCDEDVYLSSSWMAVPSGQHHHHQQQQRQHDQIATLRHRQAMLSLLRSNEAVLDYILREEISSVKNETRGHAGRSDTNVFLTSEETATLERRVVRRWLFHLSTFFQSEQTSKLSHSRKNSNTDHNMGTWDRKKGKKILMTAINWDNDGTTQEKLLRDDRQSSKRSDFPETLKTAGGGSGGSSGNQDAMEMKHSAEIVESNYLRERHQLYLELVQSAKEIPRGVPGSGVSQVVDFQDFCQVTCRFFAALYYLTVRLFGGPSYERVAASYCDDDDARACMPP